MGIWEGDSLTKPQFGLTSAGVANLLIPNNRTGKKPEIYKISQLPPPPLKNPLSRGKKTTYKLNGYPIYPGLLHHKEVGFIDFRYLFRIPLSPLFGDLTMNPK